MRDIEILPGKYQGIRAVIHDHPVQVYKRADYVITPGDEENDGESALAQDFNGQVAQVSVSHDGDYAIAVALAPPDHDVPGDGMEGGQQ